MIVVRNVKKCYNYPLALLKGSVKWTSGHEEPKSLQIQVVNRNTNSCSLWPIVSKQFKVLIFLYPNENNIQLFVQNVHTKQEIISLELCLTLRVPKKNYDDDDKLIRLLYVMCKNDAGDSLFEDGTFQAPLCEDNSVQSACQRISVGALICQTFFSETLPTNCSFRLELDPNTHWPVVHRFVLLNCTVSELLAMSANQLWKLVANQLMNSHLAGANFKYLAYCSFSRYVPNTNSPLWLPSKQVKGYVSLGGGGLALLSTHCLYTWPSSVEQISIRFNDERPIDRISYMDDSSNRNNRGGCFATTLGASIHELAHTFNLGHSETGIMGREFNWVEEFFLPNTYCRRKWWTDSQVAILTHHLWLSKGCDSRNKKKQQELNESSNLSSVLSIDLKNWTVQSVYGIVVVEYRNFESNLVFHNRIMTLPTKWYKVDQSIKTKQINGKSMQRFTLFVMDQVGNVRTQTVE